MNNVHVHYGSTRRPEVIIAFMSGMAAVQFLLKHSRQISK